MRATLFLRTLGLLAVAACGTDVVAPPAPTRPEPAALRSLDDGGPTASAIIPAGMSNYCSKVWPATSGWSFTYGTNHPCTAISGGTITRAGMYSTAGRNRVLLSCKPNFFLAFDGVGNAPLDQAYAAANVNRAHWGGCVFTVAPARMPIFDWPFDPNGTYPANYHGSGFDFERPPYGNAGVKIDYRGQSVAMLDDHDAHDFGMAPGTPLRAVADGVVIVAGMFTGIYTNCNRVPGLPTETGKPDCGHQGIVIVRHVVSATLPQYNERIATGYFHVQSIPTWITAQCTPVDRTKAPIGEGGTCNIPVTKGQIIGYSGRRGTAQAHLHFATWRLSNTTRTDAYGYRAPDHVLHAPSCCNVVAGAVGPSLVIEPYGWRPTTVMDPWAHKARLPFPGYPSGAGALSIRLWKVDPPIHW